VNVVEQPFHDFLFAQAEDFTCPVDDEVVSTVAFTASSRLLFLSKIQMNQVSSLFLKNVATTFRGASSGGAVSSTTGVRAVSSGLVDSSSDTKLSFSISNESFKSNVVGLANFASESMALFRLIH
jgi:hypothetical protein